MNSFAAVAVWFLVFVIWALVSSHGVAKSAAKVGNFLVFLLASSLTGLVIYALSDEVGKIFEVFAATLVLIAILAGLVMGWTNYKPGVRMDRFLGKIVENIDAIGRFFGSL